MPKVARGYVEADKFNFCSYPRSGTHWVLSMLQGCTEGVFKGGWREAINKTHSFHQFRNPVVYMYRHGKDCILSYAKMRHYKLAVQKGTYEGSFDAKFLKWIIEKERLPLRWKVHVDYYFSLYNTKICYVRYEDFLVSPVEKLWVIMEFYGMDTDKLDVGIAQRYHGLKPAQRTAFTSAPGITGYLPQLDQVKRGQAREGIERRLYEFTDRFRVAEEWTEEIDVMVNKVIGDTLLQHGYLP